MDFTIIKNRMPNVVSKIQERASVDSSLSNAQSMLSSIDIQVSRSIQTLDTLLTVLASGDYYSDLMFSNTTITLEQAYYDNRKEISQEDFDVLKSCLDSLTGDDGCITLSDENGNAYVIQKSNYAPLTGVHYFNFYRRSSPSGVQFEFLYEEDGSYFINNTLFSLDHDSYTTLASLIISLKESLALNNAIHDITHLVTTNCANYVNSALNVITELLTSTYDSVRQFAKGIRDSLGSGFAGVANYLVNYFKALRDVSVDDGLLVLTDNSALVPQIYLAGAIISLVTTIVQVASAIVAFAAPIVGGALFIVGSVVQAVVNAIPSLEDSYAKIDVKDNVASVDCLPHAAIQYKDISLYRLPIAIRNMIESGVESGIVDVPFGKLFYGPNYRNSDGSVTQYLLEFHPSGHAYGEPDHYTWFEDLLGRPEYERDGSNLSIYYESNIEDWVAVVQSIVELAKLEYPLDVDDNGYYKNNDADLRANIERNIAGFTMWFNILMALTSSSNTGVMALDMYCSNDHTIQGSYQGDNSDVKAMTGYFYGQFRKYFCKNPNTNQYTVSAFNRDSEQYVTLGFNDGTNPVISWTDLPGMCTQLKLLKDYTYWPNNLMYSDSIATMHSQFIIGGYREYPYTTLVYAIKPPKYNLAASIAFLILTSLATIAITVCIVRISLKIKRWKRKSAAKHAAKVNKAYDAFAHDPDNDALYNEYLKEVKRNNWMSYLNGGTKYSKSDYWFGGTADSASSLYLPTNGLTLFGTDSLPNNKIIYLISGERID